MWCYSSKKALVKFHSITKLTWKYWEMDALNNLEKTENIATKILPNWMKMSFFNPERDGNYFFFFLFLWY
jgi:hypothetical protein